MWINNYHILYSLGCTFILRYLITWKLSHSGSRLSWNPEIIFEMYNLTCLLLQVGRRIWDISMFSNLLSLWSIHITPSLHCITKEVSLVGHNYSSYRCCHIAEIHCASLAGIVSALGWSAVRVLRDYRAHTYTQTHASAVTPRRRQFVRSVPLGGRIWSERPGCARFAFDNKNTRHRDIVPGPGRACFLERVEECWICGVCARTCGMLGWPCSVSANNQYRRNDGWNRNHTWLWELQAANWELHCWLADVNATLHARCCYKIALLIVEYINSLTWNFRVCATQTNRPQRMQIRFCLLNFSVYLHYLNCPWICECVCALVGCAAVEDGPKDEPTAAERPERVWKYVWAEPHAISRVHLNW